MNQLSLVVLDMDGGETLKNTASASQKKNILNICLAVK